jgi:transposase
MAKSFISHPQWALKHKKSGAELRLINGKYYLYEYKTVYDKVKKGPKKVSGSILGSITEKEGFIPSPKRTLKASFFQDSYEGVRCKEFGVPSLITSVLAIYSRALEQIFGEDWKNIVAIAYCRFVYRCPLKSIPFRLASSFLPELLALSPFNEKQSSGILNRIGGQPDKRSQYMKSFIHTDDYILMDATNVLSQSEQISLAKKGYSQPLNFEMQFNLMYVYSATSKMPVYYKLLPGNIREVKAFKNTLLEAGLHKAVVVADKGFYSKENISLLQQEKLQFILPLRRDNALIDYSTIHNNTFKEGANFFQHAKRPVWFKKYEIEEELSLHLFLDDQLRVKEETDYLARIKTHPENYSIAEYHKRKDRFGTIALLTNLKDNDENVYLTYKSRMAIEIMFDGMKNILHADHTYMQNEQTLHGWMFINHLTLQWYQHLYIELKEKGLLKQISVNDYIQLLTDVKKVKINDKWYLNEFTNQTKKLIDKLKIKWI